MWRRRFPPMTCLLGESSKLSTHGSWARFYQHFQFKYIGKMDLTKADNVYYWSLYYCHNVMPEWKKSVFAFMAWASYQIRKIADCACARNAGNVFPHTADFKGNRYLAIPACITARASRTCRDACRDRLPAVAGKTFQAFPARAHPQFYVSGKRPMKLSNDGQFVCYIHRSWATANGIHPSWHWIACFIYHTFAFIDFEEDVDLGFVKYLVPRQ